MADSHSTLIRGCTKCGISKPLTEFHRAKRGLYGHQAFCKECAKLMARKRYEEKGEEINAKTLAKYHARQEPIRQEKAKKKEERLAIPSKLCAKCKKIKDKSLFGKSPDRPDGLRPYCKECHRLGNRKYRENNPTTSLASSRNWIAKNPERYAQSRRRRQSRIEYRIRSAISSRISCGIKGGKNGRSIIHILGYSIEELKNHLERQFIAGMNWDNYGKWHIDHIVPLSAFNITSTDCQDLRIAWGLPNLRPLWAIDNIRKNAKITHLL
jgi:hypothetical protein